MTVISAFISKYGITVATDSMLTIVDSSNNYRCLEWEQPKLIPVNKLRACFSYWGFAGTLKKVPKGNQVPEWDLQTYDWLRKQSLNPQQNNLEDFAAYITEQLNVLLTNKNLLNRGLGIHLCGFENIDDYWIPELFLITNYINPGVQTPSRFEYSRHTYHTVANVVPDPIHRDREYRIQVKERLVNGGYISYNNGDNALFNTASNSIFQMIEIANSRNILKKVQNIGDTVPLVRRPIEIVSEIQKDFFLPEQRIVGGKVHDLSIDNYGIFYSTSGDKN